MSGEILTDPDVRCSYYIAAIYPDGTRSGCGRLPCPHCGALHINPETDTDLWTLAQARALAAMNASRICAECGKPSVVAVIDSLL